MIVRVVVDVCMCMCGLSCSLSKSSRIAHFWGKKKQCETLKSFVTYEDRIEVPHICFQCQSEVPNVVEAGCVVSEVQNKERQKAYFI